MGMREYSSSGYLVDLRFFKSLDKNKALTSEEMEKFKQKIDFLELDGLWNEYLEDNDPDSCDYNFYEFLEEFGRENGEFTYFTDEDNPECFEFNVLYLTLDEYKLYKRTKTEYNLEFDKLGIKFEFGNFGFWG